MISQSKGVSRGPRAASFGLPIAVCRAYLGRMLPRPPNLPAGFIPPCLPIKAPKPPSGALWLHEIKHDGFSGSSPARTAHG
jgi:hypothetical protein